MNTNEEVFYRGANGLTGVPIANEQLGFALAAGDFNGDGTDDLAVGIPGNPCAGQVNAGSVMVLLGQANPGGLNAAGVSYWSQTAAGILDDCEAGDRFAAALVVGRFNQTPIGDPVTDDLAIGVPGEAIDGVALAGAVNVIYGSQTGLTASGNRLIHEGQFPGGTLAAAAFGTRLASGRINQGALTHDSLVVAGPLAAQDGFTFAGRVWVIPSSAGNLAPARAQLFSLAPAYALGPAAAQTAFGAQLAIGDFNDDGANDLAVGVPGSDATADGAGAVQVIYQSQFIFIDDFED